MDLEGRLDNWGRAERPGRRASGNGIVSGRRSGAELARSVLQCMVDRRDAQLVTDAWKQLDPFDRDMLRMYYIWRAPHAVICRRLDIRPVPYSVFELRLASSRRQISAILHQGDIARKKGIVFSRLRTIIGADY